MIEEIMDDVKRTLNIPIRKKAKDLYFVIDKVTGKKILNDMTKPFIITKNEIKKLKDEYMVITVADDMQKNYEKKLENQRERMEYESMSYDEKVELLEK